MNAADPAPMPRRTLIAGLVALTTTACARVAFFAANAPALFGAYKRDTEIAYGEDPLQRLDLYVPDGPSPQPRPVVVFWHGGGWVSGDKRDYRFVGAALASLGCVAVLPNYRLYPQVKMPGFISDAALAAAWAANYAREFQDPRRFYLMGHSAGAHLAALVTLDPRYFVRAGQPIPPIAGVIGLSGPYDFLPLKEDDLKDMFGPPELYALSQPINFARADAPPMLLVHGADDGTVLPRNSRNLAAALRARGVPVTLHIYPGLRHADTVAALSEPARGRAPVFAEIKEFVGAALLA